MLLAISYEMHSVIAYTCVLLIGGFSLKISQSGCPKVPAQAAVQVVQVVKTAVLGHPCLSHSKQIKFRCMVCNHTKLNSLYVLFTQEIPSQYTRYAHTVYVKYLFNTWDTPLST